jgi:hypothetical protein
MRPLRVPGTPHTTTVVTADLLPGTNAYCDIYREAMPLLVIDAGPTEIHLSMPVDRLTIEDLRIVDAILEALAAFRNALLVYLD